MIMPVCGRKGRKMELIVPFDSQSESPLYEQIYQYIKNEIRQGKLESGSRLPSTRILARNLRLSRSTTQMAYDQLLSEGYIEALPCKGYFVCKIEELVEVPERTVTRWIFLPEELIWTVFPLIHGGKSAGIHWWMITRRCLRQETPRGKGLSGLP